MTPLRVAGSLALALAASLPALAVGHKQLALEDLTAEPPVSGRPLVGLTWIPGQERFSYLRRTGADPAAADLYVEDAASGTRERVAEGKALQTSLQGYVWSPDGKTLLLNSKGELSLYHVDRKALDVLVKDDVEFPSFSPDGLRLAFVRKHNLYVLELATRKETALSKDGDDHVFNGCLDWVYQEELAERSGRAYEWSPDGKSVAYLRLDENRVPAYPLVDFLTLPHAGYQSQRYPNPGDPNSAPSIKVASVEGQPLAKVEFTPNDDLYVVPWLAWTPDSKTLVYELLNRSQTEWTAKRLDVASGASTSIVEERDASWINVNNVEARSPAAPVSALLKDGRFLWLSERTGYEHLYVGRLAGGALTPVTRGEWALQHVIGVDEARGAIYFSSTQGDVRERQLFRIGFDGSALTPLTHEPGTHDGDVSPRGGYILETYSSLGQPTRTQLLRADGSLVRTVDEPESRLGEFELGSTELLDVKAEDGAVLHGLLVKPRDFDPAKRYPVLVRVYGGPHAQTVRNAFATVNLFDHYLAERGYLVWRLDNRGSSGRGHLFETPILKRMGKLELADQLAGVAYLKSLPYVDAARIGINGWSYGGYMTLYALTNAPDAFRCGIAGAPVVDWRLYDTIYTERYMRTPQENPEGYKDSAPLTHAAKLKARLLLIHGTADDNVHPQNAMAFADALIKAGIPFELQVQPGQRHGFGGKTAQHYLLRAMAEFLDRNLKGS